MDKTRRRYVLLAVMSAVALPCAMAACSANDASTTEATPPRVIKESGPTEAAGSTGSGKVALPNATPHSRPEAPDKAESSQSVSASETPFIARLRKPMAVTSMLAFAKVGIVGDCLVADFGSGSLATLVLPPQADIEGPNRAPTAIRINLTRIRLGIDQSIPGGGGSVRASDLVMPIPSYCPGNLFIIGG